MSEADPDDYGGFMRGELVRVKSMPALTGTVIGDQDWGMKYKIRLVGMFEPKWFDDCELESVPAAEPDGGGGDVISLAEYRRRTH